MRVREYRYGNATILISRPELTDAELENEKRRVLVSLQQFGKEMKECKKHGNNDKSRTSRK